MFESIRSRYKIVPRRFIPFVVGVLLLIAAAIVLPRLLSKPAVDPPPSSSASPKAQNTTLPTVPAKNPGAKAVAQQNGSYIATLVNYAHPLDKKFKPNLVDIPGDFQFDAIAAPHLERMLGDAWSQGYSPIVCSAYRDYDTQQNLFSQEAASYETQGYSKSEAEDMAARSVARPGHSEHELGLAVDITLASRYGLDEEMENEPGIIWLHEHCAEYGFILRYPKDKTDITQISYEPWHFRYLGLETAKAVYESGLCYEEYLETL
jgi:D-alanyl-D-alanine carboxypeptidase